MDRLIYTAFNTLNNIYDNRSVRAQNMANVNVPGYRRDLGTKSVGSAFLTAENTFQTRALAIRDDSNIFESEPGTLSQTGSDMDVALRGNVSVPTVSDLETRAKAAARALGYQSGTPELASSSKQKCDEKKQLLSHSHFMKWSCQWRQPIIYES